MILLKIKKHNRSIVSIILILLLFNIGVHFDVSSLPVAVNGSTAVQQRLISIDLNAPLSSSNTFFYFK